MGLISARRASGRGTTSELVALRGLGVAEVVCEPGCKSGWMGHDSYMVERMKRHWREFRESKPGRRFEERYRRRRQDEQGHIVWRIFLIALGAVIAVGSLVLAPLPGPGWATVFVGLMILGGELLPAARFLDWLEVRLRNLWFPVQRAWRASFPGKVAVVVVAVLCAAAIVYVGYLLLFSGSLS
jgi:uncharacterized protein (TIGR02611 family)